MVEKISNVLRYYWIKWTRPGKIISRGLHGIGCGSIFKIKGLLHIGERTTFGRYNYIDIQGELRMGQRCYVNDNVRIVCHKEIRMGDHVLIASGVSIYDHDHLASMHDDQLMFNGYTCASINIGSRVWLGEKVIILKGVSVGNNVIIGAGSVVVSDIPSNSVAVGNPCRVVKSLAAQS